MLEIKPAVEYPDERYPYEKRDEVHYYLRGQKAGQERKRKRKQERKIKVLQVCNQGYAESVRRMGRLMEYLHPDIDYGGGYRSRQKKENNLARIEAWREAQESGERRQVRHDKTLRGICRYCKEWHN